MTFADDTSPAPTRVALFGGGEVAHFALRRLQDIQSRRACKIVGLYQSNILERESSPTREFALAQGIRVFRDPAEVLEIDDLELVFSIGNSWIFPVEFIKKPRRGIINFHCAPLPRYKGSATPAFAILNGEKEFGVTFHKIAPALDQGPIIQVESFPITADMTAGEVDRKGIETGIRCFEDHVEDFLAGRYEEQEQEDCSTPYRRVDIEQYRKLDPTWEASKRWDHIRACDWDGVLKPAYFEIEGRQVFVTARLRGSFIESRPAIPKS